MALRDNLQSVRRVQLSALQLSRTGPEVGGVLVEVGIGLRGRYRVQPLPLEPGDRLIFLTDGVLERDAATLNLDAVITQTADMHPREAVQHIIRAVLELTDGNLQDDATIMCLDWHGGPRRDRDDNRAEEGAA